MEELGENLATIPSKTSDVVVESEFVFELLGAGCFDEEIAGDLN
jgi:hypothetical protein